jgi:hypothetical protein
MIDTQQEQYNAPAPTEANAEIGEDDVFDNSDDDDETISHTSNHTKRFSLFDDEEDDNVPETQNPHLIKDQVTKKMLGLIAMIQQQLTKKKITQEKQIIKTSITLNNGRIMKKKRVVQPLTTINQIKSLQQQTNQMQKVTTKEQQITS